MPAFIRAIIKDRLYLANSSDETNFGDEFRCLRPVEALSYVPYCDDFGPVNMSSVVHFIHQLDAEFAAYPDRKIVFCVEQGRRTMTNAVFLIGAYMILKHDMSPAVVSRCFAWLDSRYVVAYRDATFCRADFSLHLIDCWRGLAKGQALGWVRYAASGYMWGEIDIDEYRHYDSPANGCLHQVVPGKLIAFQGPEDLGGPDYIDTQHGGRVFSPSYYAEVLQDFGVETVVRLNEPLYDAASFAACGMQHVDLPFEDCSCPPDAVVAAFLRAVDAAPGAVAVHCKAGLGRTGTLVALYMMRSCGFAAREAMGWLRIMRPGCVIGEQQHYLCAVERARQQLRRPAPTSPPAAADEERGSAVSAQAVRALSPSAHSAAAVEGFRCRAQATQARQVEEGMARRSAAMAARTASTHD
jgi:cell division cycle 14